MQKAILTVIYNRFKHSYISNKKDCWDSGKPRLPTKVASILRWYLLSSGPNFGPPHTHYYPGAIFFKMEWFPSWITGKALIRNEVDWLLSFCRLSSPKEI